MSTHPTELFEPAWPRSFAQVVDLYLTDEGVLLLTLLDSHGYRTQGQIEMISGGLHIVLGEAGTRPCTLLSTVPRPRPAALTQNEDGSWWVSTDDEFRLRIAVDPFLALYRESADGLHAVWTSGPLLSTADRDIEPSLYRGLGYAPDGPAWLTVPLHPGEACYGLGERFGSFNHRGQVITLWADDAFGLPSNESYIGVPFLLSNRGWAMLLPTAAPTRWDVGARAPDALSVAVAEPWLDFYVVAGSPREALGFLQEVSGPPAAVPLWSYGVWMSRWGYRNQDQLLGIVREMRRRHLPLDVIHLDPYWLTHKNGHTCPWEWDRQAFPDPDAMYQELSSLGVRLSLWINPFLPRGTPIYEEARRQSYLVAHPDGTPARVPRFDDDNSMVDFTNPRAVEWFETLVVRELRRGARVIKSDFGETVPYARVRFANGLDGPAGRNLNGFFYQQAVYEAAQKVYGREALVWGRSGYLGSQRYPVQWGGDSGCTYGYMATALRGALSYLLSGAMFTSFDGGGFAGTPTPDLYCRWAAMSFLFSHVRFHGTTPREPWAFGEQAEAVWRQFADLRYQLLPYLWSQSDRSLAKRLPLVRPLVLMHPEDPVVANIDDEYYLGADLLVVPLFNAEGTRQAYLPEGTWYDWFDPNRPALRGPRFISLSGVPLDRIGLFVRDGAVLPLYPSGLETIPDSPPAATHFLVAPGWHKQEGEIAGLTWRFTGDAWHFRASRPVTVTVWGTPPVIVPAGSTVVVPQESR